MYESINNPYYNVFPMASGVLDFWTLSDENYGITSDFGEVSIDFLVEFSSQTCSWNIAAKLWSTLFNRKQFSFHSFFNQYLITI